MTTDEAMRLRLVGSARVDSARYIWWNFASSSMEQIEAAKADWREQRFAGVPGVGEFIPLMV